MMVARLIASFGGVGFLPKAPGTWGSLAALPFAWLLHGLGGPFLLTIGILAAILIGVRATQEVTRDAKDHDPGWVVIDEVAGQWIALWPLSIGMVMAGSDPWVFPWPGVLGGFFLFRLFDIWKPGPVGWADRRGGPWGVMLDDVFAGLFAAIVLVATAWLGHQVLL
ncbi:phosphatidylglycerophosphatase A family protein [Pontivivens insulae]|uniref:Phosphatidylglycerophosphatase A n=1 Tax=Pontivivens insulae TaxID=1639689 RepID=A0A2R8AAY5_9RHOB|nr:phosphatidylglycerophosphatase A [Pontivivens insulae]RED13287.1 phosphatidylglycerophosphatase A [Pontivivens insulae]SPF29379.1 Phosphatidylglycerophosphatase A [Pontivivens insulae]